MASALSFTALRISSACTAASSFCGVIHATEMAAPSCRERAAALASAPRRAERNTKFASLFAMSAIFSDFV